MPDKMNGENHSLVRLFLKSGFMKELDLTKGSVLKTLLQFAVPFLIANLLQALYGRTDRSRDIAIIFRTRCHSYNDSSTGGQS